MKIVKIVSDWSIIFIFAAILSGSFLLWAFQPDKLFSKKEKRPLANFPKIETVANVKGYITQLDIYYQDHFGLREWMTHRYQQEVRKRFGESGNPLVVEGKAGWLFFAVDGVLEDLQGKLRFSDEEVNRLCRGLQAKHDWFAKQGILYIPFVAPNKQSIYENKLKDSYRVLKGAETRFEQVLNACGNGLLYDLRPELKKQSKNERVYAKTDTHWNGKGALLAYYYLMGEVQKTFPEFSFRKEFIFAEKPLVKKGGDLALMLDQRDLYKEFWPVLQPNEIQVEKGAIPSIVKQHLILPKLKPVLYRGNPSGTRLLVLRDSFYNALIAYTSVNFSESLYLWQFWDEESLKMSGPHTLFPIIKTFKPDVVIEQIVERHLDWLLESVDHDWAGSKQVSTTIEKIPL